MQWSVTLSHQFYRYEAFPHAAKDCDRLAVWKSQSENFPRLAIVGKYILGIPASSATSEIFFSAAGRMVTSDRCSLSEETVEDLVKIRLNLAKLAEEERVCGLGEGAGRAAAAAVDVYRPDQDAEEEVLLEDSTDSNEFDDM